MTSLSLVRASLWHYRRTHAAVALGVGSAVAVLAGALLVGSSVRASLASIASARLGRADVLVTGENPFGEDLGDRLRATATDVAAAAPVLMFEGTARHDASGRRAARVQVYGVDVRFFAFHGVPAPALEAGQVLLSPDLVEELGASPGDTILLRVPRSSDVPADSLFGKKDDLARALRLECRGALEVGSMGEFSLVPGQGAVRAAFVPLARLQRDMNLAGRANALILASRMGAVIDVPHLRTSLAASARVTDLGLNVDVLPDQRTVLVESTSGVMTDPIVSGVSATAAHEGLAATPVLTWLATRMTVGDRSIPYSLVSAVDAATIGDTPIANGLGADRNGRPPMVLNDWAARELRASAGDALEVEYFRWADEGRLLTDRETFTVTGVVPMRGLTADRRLAPVYPGISDSANIADWDPPFPIDLPRVRPVDDEYWRQWRATPKAFIPLAAGQRLWTTRYGRVTSVRLGPLPGDADLEGTASRFQSALARAIDPSTAALAVIAVRRQGADASQGVSDFGAYFTYFSFFLMVSGLLLAGLFFRLAIEQRFAEIGVLRAMGFSVASIRRLFLAEGGAIAIAGTIVGAGLAVVWASALMAGLGTWWVGAVGTSRLRLHVDAAALAGGTAAGAAAAIVAIAITLRAIARLSPRALVTGASEAPDAGVMVARRRRTSTLMWMSLAGALALTAAAALGAVAPAAAFFGAGGLVLVAGLTAFRRWLLAGASRELAAGRQGLIRLGIRNAAWRPGRSLVSAMLVAAAVFLLVSVESFRKGVSASTEKSSGTGGFALLAESALPMAYDPSTHDGQLALGLDPGSDAADFAGVEFVPARLRRGEDTSCLNLYRPSRPRILGVSPRWVDAARFRFAASLSADDATRANPWRLLAIAAPDGVVPAIADATSLEYVLHARVGDVITIDADTSRPARLRIVAALDDSMLQGELVVADAAFANLFPDEAGYRLLFIDVPASPDRAARLDRVTSALESRLEPYGVDVEDAARRLASYHQVENTYLSTFQALGGLGLVLGSVGLVAVVGRNIFERRRELALLGAVGFTASDVRAVVLAEQAAVIVAGLGIGLGAAAVAVGPVIASRGGGSVAGPVMWAVIVLVVGLTASAGAARRVRRLPLLASLRGD